MADGPREHLNVPEWVALRRAHIGAQIIVNGGPTVDTDREEAMLDVIERAALVVADIEQKVNFGWGAYERYTALNIGFGILTTKPT